MTTTFVDDDEKRRYWLRRECIEEFKYAQNTGAKAVKWVLGNACLDSLKDTYPNLKENSNTYLYMGIPIELGVNKPDWHVELITE